MDPHELNSSQLDYELMLRGEPLRGGARQRANRVQKLISEEANGQRDMAHLNHSPMVSAHDLELCSFLCHELDESVSAAQIDSRSLTTYWNRVVHLNARLERIRPSNAHEDQQLCNLLFMARATRFAIAQRREPNFNDDLFESSGPPVSEQFRHQKVRREFMPTAQRGPVPTMDAQPRPVADIERELRENARQASEVQLRNDARNRNWINAVSSGDLTTSNFLPPLSQSSRRNSARDSIEARAKPIAISNEGPIATKITGQPRPNPTINVPAVSITDCTDDEERARPKRTEEDLYRPNALTCDTWSHLGKNPVRDSFDCETPSHLTFHDGNVVRIRRTHDLNNHQPRRESFPDQRSSQASPFCSGAPGGNPLSQARYTGARPKTNEYKNWRATKLDRGSKAIPSVSQPIYTTANIAWSVNPTVQTNGLAQAPIPQFQTAVTYTLPKYGPILSHSEGQLMPNSQPIQDQQVQPENMYNTPPPLAQKWVRVDTPDPRLQHYAPASSRVSAHNYATPTSVQHPVRVPQCTQLVPTQYRQTSQGMMPVTMYPYEGIQEGYALNGQVQNARHQQVVYVSPVANAPNTMAPYVEYPPSPPQPVQYAMRSYANYDQVQREIVQPMQREIVRYAVSPSPQLHQRSNERAQTVPMPGNRLAAADIPRQQQTDEAAVRETAHLNRRDFPNENRDFNREPSDNDDRYHDSDNAPRQNNLRGAALRRGRHPDEDDSDASSAPSSSRSGRRRGDRPDENRNRPHARARHNDRQKTVPINQWRISFSGDANSTNKNDINLHNFLEQIDMFRRAGRIEEDDLLLQVCHLLNGSARAWFQNVYRDIHTWRAFERAIKAKFLATDYNFSLIAEVENRRQGKTEPVSTFINEMELKFRAMPIPMSDAHKLYIIQRNLLPSFTFTVAAQNPRSIRDLEAICKRLESARTMLSNREQNQAKASTTRDKPKYRSVNAVSELKENETSSERESEDETDNKGICAVSNRESASKRSTSKPVRSADKKTLAKEKSSEKSPAGNVEACYNCKADGHIQRDCKEPMRKRCFKCGLEKYTVATCPKCHPELEKKAEVNQVDEEQADSPQTPAP